MFGVWHTKFTMLIRDMPFLRHIMGRQPNLWHREVTNRTAQEHSPKEWKQTRDNVLIRSPKDAGGPGLQRAGHWRTVSQMMDTRFWEAGHWKTGLTGHLRTIYKNVDIEGPESEKLDAWEPLGQKTEMNKLRTNRPTLFFSVFLLFFFYICLMVVVLFQVAFPSLPYIPVSLSAVLFQFIFVCLLTNVPGLPV